MKTTNDIIRELNSIIDDCNSALPDTNLQVNEMIFSLCLVSTAFQDGRQSELLGTLSDMMPEYDNRSLKEVLLNNSIRGN